MSRPASPFLMSPPAGPAERRGSLRELIRRQTLELLDRRWHQLWGSFGMAAILIGFGGSLLWRHGADKAVQALALLAAGGIVAWMHWQLRRSWQHAVQSRDDWLSRRDQGLVTLGLWLSVSAPSSADWWPIPLLAGSGYGVWQLGRNARLHWPSWHFRLARQILRAHEKGPHRLDRQGP
jgi:hypothetical protein